MVLTLKRTMAEMVDAKRVAELTAREQQRLNDRTPNSARLSARARKSMVNGVPSSYQQREPWPIFLTEGRGSKVWDVDGNEYVDFHNGFGSMVQGHAHPAIVEAVQARVARGSHFAASSSFVKAMPSRSLRTMPRHTVRHR